MNFIIYIFIVGFFILSNSLAQEYKKIEYLNNNTLLMEKRPHNPLSIMEEFPEDFPKITIDSVNNPAPGFIFMECFDVSATKLNYIMVADKDGKIVYYNKPHNLGIDFKMQPNGRLSYSSRVKTGDQYQAGPIKVQNIYVQQMVLDKDYNIIDSVQTQNGYLADMHDFRILPNGNYMLIAYEHVPVDMSKVVPGGNPNAVVVGTVIQELDKDKNCVFQWRSMDRIPILATKDDPRKAMFEHVHGNSLFLDKDGNLITSFPTTFEIVKIDMVTGDMIWRFGGDNNQFEITGDNELDKPYYFRMQHDAKLLPNGNMLFYDNAVQKKSGWSSRAVEYSFDQENKKAGLLWEYKHNPPISAFAMGSAQRLSNGNTLIDWGLIFTGLSKAMTEVTPEGKTTFEMTMPNLTFSYRAQKYELPACMPIANVDKFEMLQGNTYKFNESNNETNVEIFFEELDAFTYNALNVKKYDCTPINIEFEQEAPVVLPIRYVFKPELLYTYKCDVRFDVTKLPPHFNPENMIVFYRAKPDSGVFHKLITSFDVNENQIVAKVDEFGEFIIGFERKATEVLAPALMYPINQKKFVNNSPVRFVWSSTGRYDKFQLQIAEDANFSNIIFDSSDVKIPIIQKENFDTQKTYYWRTKTIYRDLESNWSVVRSFDFSDPYIKILYPKGGETLYKDSTYVFRWETNIDDSVKVSILRNYIFDTLVKDSLYSFSNAIAYKIPKTIISYDKFLLSVETVSENPVSATSENYFSIDNAVNVDENSDIIIKTNTLAISPNPSSEVAKVEFTIFNSSHVNLTVIDPLGNEKQVLLNSYLNEGTYNFNLNLENYIPGVYYCVLKDANTSTVKKIVVIR